MDDFDCDYESARKSKRAAKVNAKQRRKENLRVAKYEPVDQSKWRALGWRVIQGDKLSKEERAYYNRGRREQRYRDGILAYQDFKRVEDLAGVEVREGARGEFKVYPLANKLGEADQQILQDGRAREAGQESLKRKRLKTRLRLAEGVTYKDKCSGVFFKDKGLPSERSRVLKRFVQCTHKTKKRKPHVAKHRFWARPGAEFRPTSKDIKSARITSLDGKFEWIGKHFLFEPTYEDRPARVKIHSLPDDVREGEEILIHLEMPPLVLRSGDEKCILVDQDSKLFGLDQRYI